MGAEAGHSGGQLFGGRSVKLGAVLPVSAEQLRQAREQRAARAEAQAPPPESDGPGHSRHWEYTTYRRQLADWWGGWLYYWRERVALWLAPWLDQEER